MSIPQHILDLLRPLHPDTSFSLRGELVSSDTSDQRYLFKRAQGADAVQLEGEAASLRAMNEACVEVAPKLVGTGKDDDGKSWMLSEWHELSSIPSSAQPQLAEYLAQMHLSSPPPGTKFGFPVPTRIGDMVERIGDPELKKLETELRERVIPALLDNLDIKPSILHGDLWSGNARFSENRNQPITFDPSSYYGHSEADLGITHMFGGFSTAFYKRYHELVPKTEPAEEYEQRQQLYELYHHLNHALMFGGGYKSGAVRLIRGLLSWADEKGV
ncbi:hypothetical protein JCM10213_001365 [Rhodosporidiobolus nylandii]